MALLGQASGGFTEGSSALRVLYVGVRNSVGVLTNDAFTQLNPPTQALAATLSTSPGFLANTLGTLSGSVAFTRPDGLAGTASVGGPAYTATATAFAGALTDVQAIGVQPVGCFINNASGNPFENTPAAASGKGPYVSSQGTYGNGLFETQTMVVSGALAQGAAITYQVGVPLITSVNGYLMPRIDASAIAGIDLFLTAQSYEFEQRSGGGAPITAVFLTPLVLGVLKMTPDAVMNELVYDQRI